MRDCNNCVYSTRDGGCRKFTCEGTKTVEDIRANVIDECKEQLTKCWLNGTFAYRIVIELQNSLDELKEQKNE